MRPFLDSSALVRWVSNTRRLTQPLAAAFFILLLLPDAFANSVGGQPSTKPVETTVLDSSPEHLRIRFTIPPILPETLQSDSGESRALFAVPDEGTVQLSGRFQLPAVSRWVLLPPTGEISLEVTSLNSETVQAPPPALPDKLDIPRANPNNEADEVAELPSGFWPPKTAEISPPMIMRGYRLAQVTFYPVQYDPSSGLTRLNTSCELSLVSKPGGMNEVNDPGRARPSSDFDRLLRGIVLNPPPLTRDIGDKHGAVV